MPFLIMGCTQILHSKSCCIRSMSQKFCGPCVQVPFTYIVSHRSFSNGNSEDISRSSSSMTSIKENYHVVLKKGTIMKILKISRNRVVKFDKKTFSLQAAIGQPFGTTWEVQSGQVVPVQKPQLASIEKAKSVNDNREMQDDTSSQKLQHDEIASLKEQGVSGEGIIERLVDNSVSFENKTAYSQAKYIKKKTDKHLTRFMICKPSTRLISEIHWRQVPSPKLIHLRPDTLAQLMTSSNIQSGSKVIIVEHCQGLVVAAALERLAGKGNLVHLHTEDIPVITVEESFDFPKEYTDIALRMQLQYFYKVLKADEVEEDSNGEKKEDGSEKLQEVKSEQPKGEEVVAAQPQAETIVEPKAESLVQTEGESIAQPQANTIAQPQAETFAQPQAQLEPIQRMKRKHPENAERVQRRKMREENNQKIANLMNGKNMDVLIVACRYRPTPIVTHLLEYLAPSRSLVVYSSASEPLVECYNQLRESGQVINMRFSETWLREYQVLENRTHPLVNMSGTGGYILTGTKVERIKKSFKDI